VIYLGDATPGAVVAGNRGAGTFDADRVRTIHAWNSST